MYNVLLGPSATQLRHVLFLAVSLLLLGDDLDGWMVKNAWNPVDQCARFV